MGYKRLILFLIFIFSILSISNKAQNVVNEIHKEIEINSEELKNLVNSGNYYLAIKETERIQYSLKILYGLSLDTNLIPTQLNEYKLDYENRSNEIDGDNITLIREYKKQGTDPALNNECLLSLIISNNDQVINKIANIHAFSFNLIDEENRKYKPIEIEGYKALLVFERKKRFLSMAVALSNKTIVKINMTGIEDVNKIISIAKLINYKLIKETMP